VARSQAVSKELNQEGVVMDLVIERALIKAMVKVMSLEDELQQIDRQMYDEGHLEIIRTSIERDLEAWKLILKLIQNESKGNSN
jgi:GTP-binding protein EngB required for normal cell division